MQRRSLVAVLVIVLSLAASRAEAVTVRDVIELSKAGLSDSVLLALIDVDRSVFSIDTATLKQLKSAGVSDAVIVAMIKSGREPLPQVQPPVIAQEPVPPPQAPQDSEPGSNTAGTAAVTPPPVPYPVAIPFPVYVAVPVTPSRRPSNAVKERDRADLPPNCQAAQVPNWGFGGTIRQLPPVCR